MAQETAQDFTFQLRKLLGKFPAGLKLTPHDLVFVGWLYFWEKSTREKDIPERELAWQVDQAVKTLRLTDAISSSAALERLLQYRLVRRSIIRFRPGCLLPDPPGPGAGPVLPRLQYPAAGHVAAQSAPKVHMGPFRGL
jgi:hypothetical protein